jgi:hypothetical protein
MAIVIENAFRPDNGRFIHLFSNKLNFVLRGSKSDPFVCLSSVFTSRPSHSCGQSLLAQRHTEVKKGTQQVNLNASGKLNPQKFDKKEYEEADVYR